MLTLSWRVFLQYVFGLESRGSGTKVGLKTLRSLWTARWLNALDAAFICLSWYRHVVPPITKSCTSITKRDKNVCRLLECKQDNLILALAVERRVQQCEMSGCRA